MAVIVINDVATKWMSGDYPVHQIVFVRSLVAIPITVLLLAPLEGARIRVRTSHPLLNIAINARDAMPKGGVLAFQTHVETIVDAALVRDLIPRLRAAGAEGILEYELRKMV